MNTKTEIKYFVFRTSLQSRQDVERTSAVLNKLPGMLNWSIDLEDWEKVLRIECTTITAAEVVTILKINGISANEMEAKW